MAQSIIIAGLPSSRKTPGVYLNVILGGPGTGAGAAPERLMLTGNMIVADITLSAPAMTILAGTATLAEPVQVYSESDAIEKFGRGSELHLMCAAAFDQDPTVVLWATPVGEAAGATAATTTLTFTGTVPTEDLTLDLYIDGQKVEVIVPTSAADLTAIATLVAQAVLDVPDLPLTAQFALGVVTFTSKQKGTRNKLIQVKLDVSYGTRTYRLRTGALAATTKGLTSTLAAATLATAGAGTETTTFTTALAAMNAERWDRIAMAQADSTNIVAAGNASVSKAAVTSMLWEQVIAGNTIDLTDLTNGPRGMTAAVNNPRVQLVWHYASPRSPGVLAAQVAAGRLMGDGHLGGSCVGESADPAANLDGLQLATIPVQEFVADRPIPSEVEAALNYGICVLAPSSARPGYAEVVRSVTTRYKDSSGAVNYAVLDTSEVTVTDHVADRIRTEMRTAYARAKLADDDPEGNPPKVFGIVTPSSLKSFIAGILVQEEEAGHIINVQLHMSKLVVVRDTDSRGRANAEIPVEPAPAFHIFGGNVRQLAA